MPFIKLRIFFDTTKTVFYFTRAFVHICCELFLSLHREKKIAVHYACDQTFDLKYEWITEKWINESKNESQCAKFVLIGPSRTIFTCTNSFHSLSLHWNLTWVTSVGIYEVLAKLCSQGIIHDKSTTRPKS